MTQRGETRMIEPNDRNRVLVVNRGQRGSAILSFVICLGIVLLLVQGSTWFQSKAGAKFIGTEKKKVVAMQMAEAGVEENIADLATRTVHAAAGMTNVVTYDHQPLEGGSYTSSITTVALGSSADTVDLVSQGSVGTMQQTILARLGLNKRLDTTRSVIAYVAPETTATVVSVNVADTSLTLPPNAATMPAVNTTSAYTSCMAGASPTCQVCHLPLRPNPSGRVVLTHPKAVVGSHNSHIGDYISLDGTCDLYDTTMTFSFHTKLDTTYAIVDKNIYDTVAVIDTLVKVQILSWR
jgi:hypothetical protein